MLCDDERERAARGKMSQFEQKVGLSRHVLKRAAAVAVKVLASASIALPGIYVCQRIDSYEMTVDILQDSNCAVKQPLAEHISTYGHPKKGDMSCHSL